MSLAPPPVLIEPPMYVMWNGLPRRVAERKISEQSGQPFCILCPEIGFTNMEAVMEADCKALTYDESLIIRDVATLTDDELTRAHELLRQRRAEKADSPKAQRAQRKAVRKKAEPKFSGWTAAQLKIFGIDVAALANKDVMMKDAKPGDKPPDAELLEPDDDTIDMFLSNTSQD